MGNRSSSTKIYSLPSFFSLSKIRSHYNVANDDMKTIFRAIVPLKANFRIYCSGTQYDLQINCDEAMTLNRAPLSIILQVPKNFDDIAFLQFDLKDQKILFEN